MALIALMGCDKQTRASLTGELGSPSEDQDIRDSRKKENDLRVEQEKKHVEEERRAEADRKRLAEVAELHRQQEIADRERLDREGKEAKAEAKANAIETAFKAFESVPDCQVRRLALTQTGQRLCPFDAEHLIDPGCDLTVIESETGDICIERDPATDQTPFAWTVTGKQFDSISGIWRDPVVVCRLVVREGSLCIEWPNTAISDEHEFFRALENGMLSVSCLNATGDSEIVRQILLAEPIDLASANNATIALDPLAEKPVVSFDSQVAQRLKYIPPRELSWTIELTHPKWPSPRQFSKPDTKVALKFPSAEFPEIEIGYQDANPKSGGLDKFVGKLRVEATLRFSPQEAAISLIDRKITGFDHVPLLKPVITIAGLRRCLPQSGRH